jgi:hypothetical protein
MKTDPFEAGVLRASQAFLMSDASRVRSFMKAVDRAIQADDCHPIWFQMEVDSALGEAPIEDILWAMMTRDVWKAHGEELNRLALEYDLEPTEM